MTRFDRHRRRTGRSLPVPAVPAELLEDRLLLTVTLQIDYSLDNGFFVGHADRQAAIQSVANEIGSRLNDTLKAIPSGTYQVTDPKTYTQTTVTFSSAADSIRVFVAGSALGGSTVGQGGWRTNTGVRYFDSRADFQPYVGYIGFDNDGSTTWDFTGGSGAGTDFLSVARHEMLHVLGIGGAATWDALVSGGVFTGRQATAANGGVHPAVTSDGGHFAPTVNSIMRPVMSSIDHPTAVDWGALADIGWNTSTVAPSGTYADVLGRTGDGTWWVSRNQGTLLSPSAFGRWVATAGWQDVHTGDFNGDGRTDVAGRTSGGAWYVGLNTGSGFANHFFGYWDPRAQWHDVLFGDFSGDGRTDIAGRTSGGAWFVSRSTGTAFATSFWATWNEFAQWRDVGVGDFDGDGHADVAGRTNNGAWYVARSTGTAFTTAYGGIWNALAGWQDVVVADFDGNGKADVAGRAASGEWYVGLTVGTSATGFWFSTGRWATWSPNAGWRGGMVGDFGGDTRPDVIARTATGQWYLAVNIGGSFFSTIPYGAWVEGAWQTVLAADFAGTTKSDVLARAADGNWYLGENTGSLLAFRPYGRWDESLGWRDVAASKRYFTAGAGAGALQVASPGTTAGGSGQLQAAPTGSSRASSSPAAAFAPPAPSPILNLSSSSIAVIRDEQESAFPASLMSFGTAPLPSLAESLFADGELLDALTAA
jgi:hypothetical protein